MSFITHFRINRSIFLLLLSYLVVGQWWSRSATAQGNDKILYHGKKTEPIVVLTFDACPVHSKRSYDERIVRTLIDSGVPATFFISGKWALAHTSTVQFLASVPHFEIGNHSFSHPHCTRISRDSLVHEIRMTQSILKQITGKAPSLFRAPYGELNDAVVMCAESLGLQIIQFDLASGDPDSSFTKQRLLENIRQRVRNGSIIVFHVNGRGWHTAEALPEIIGELRKRGFRFVTVSAACPNLSESYSHPSQNASKK